jgi:hypothetical protein
MAGKWIWAMEKNDAINLSAVFSSFAGGVW